MRNSDFNLPVPSPSVVFKQFEDGGVLLSTRDEVYFGVNAVGARIWSLLPPAAETFEEMCAILAREYKDVSIERLQHDVKSFLDHLVATGLATKSSRGTTDGSPDAHTADKGSS